MKTTGKWPDSMSETVGPRTRRATPMGVPINISDMEALVKFTQETLEFVEAYFIGFCNSNEEHLDLINIDLKTDDKNSD